MLTWYKQRQARHKTATDLYGAVVAQARDPVLYTDIGCPDTPDGRYEMIVLHLVMVLERLRSEAAMGQALSRGLIEVFVTDMDDSFREMGVGDLTVPKKVKGAAGGLYARAERLRTAQAPEAEPERLAAELARLTLGGLAPDDPRAARLADYVRAAARSLSVLPTSDVLAGRVTFPAIDPGARDAAAGDQP